jgi:hypothetical protein
MTAKKKNSSAKKTAKNPSKDAGGIAKADSVISRRNQNGTVILMRLDKASSFYKVDGIAAEVWACLEAPKHLETLIDAMNERYPAKKTLRRDIDDLVKKLTKLGLVAPSTGKVDPGFPELTGAPRKSDAFGGVQEFDLEQIEAEVLNESVYLDVFAGSDLRVKTDVAPIRGALAKVVQLDGITHRWKHDPKSIHAGLVAQQVAEQMPELVRRDLKTKVLAVNYQKLNSYLVEAIKDLNRVCQAQEARIRKLEAGLT